MIARRLWIRNDILSLMIQIFLVGHEWALLALRIGVAIIFLAHGLPKIKNLKATAENFSAMGFVPGRLWGTLVAILEFFGGIALLLGFFTQGIALLLAIEMAVTTLWRMRQGHKLTHGYEFDLILFLSLLVLAASGSTLFALDYYFQIYLF